MKSGIVYFVMINNAIKIGHTSNLKIRLNALQTASPTKIVVLGTIKSNQCPFLERLIRVYFDDEKIKGEFIKIDMHIIDTIEYFCKIEETELLELLMSTNKSCSNFVISNLSGYDGYARKKTRSGWVK